MKFKTISVRQPWATLIVLFGKDIENRSWHTDYRGPLLIQAAKGMTRYEWEDAIEFAKPILRKLPLEQIKQAEQALRRDLLPRQGIVGHVKVTGCVTKSSSEWFMGQYGFQLAEQKPLPFFHVKGALSLFDVDLPDDYVAANMPWFKAAA
jgi:hypothetical protein